ncbi:MAG TPA: LysR family transcriptional regulator ArgP [Dongiaceae bacterium]
MMFDTRDLASLRSVITEGSFDAAARQLNITAGALSQRIKHLEQKAGQLLVLRTQPTGLTPAGETLMRLAQQIALLTNAAMTALTHQATPTPTLLTIAVNHDSLDSWLMPAINRFGAAGDIALDIRCADADQTHRLLKDGTAVACITSVAEAMPGCRSYRLGALTYEAVATKDYAARWFNDGVTAAQLEQAPQLLFDRTDTLAQQFLRRHSKRHLMPPAHYIPSSQQLVEATYAGIGWSLLPELLIRDDLKAGRLVRLSLKSRLDRPLYWQAWSVETAAIQRLTNLVRDVARQSLAS